MAFWIVCAKNILICLRLFIKVLGTGFQEWLKTKDQNNSTRRHLNKIAFVIGFKTFIGYSTNSRTCKIVGGISSICSSFFLGSPLEITWVFSGCVSFSIPQLIYSHLPLIQQLKLVHRFTPSYWVGK